MRDAEEVAREAFHPPSDDPDQPDPAGPLSGSEWYEYALRHAERVIRARDAEVAARALRDAADEAEAVCDNIPGHGEWGDFSDWLRHRADRSNEPEGTRP